MAKKFYIKRTRLQVNIQTTLCYYSVCVHKAEQGQFHAARRALQGEQKSNKKFIFAEMDCFIYLFNQQNVQIFIRPLGFLVVT